MKSERDYGKSVLKMTHSEAREFFLGAQSYFSGNLPSYFNFERVLNNVKETLSTKTLSDIIIDGRDLKEESQLNYKIMINKDGKYAWRELQIIHPVLYVNLVNLITEEDNWSFIVNKFQENQSIFGESIKCISIPKSPRKEGKELRDTVLNWWVNTEQALIKNALDYNYCIQTDITDCYPSIYIPSIVWALHGKEESIVDMQNKDLLGSQINSCLQNIQGAIVCGIPQGSILMDFIAEIILNYADSQLHRLLNDENLLSDCLIFRYRDDYKILTKKSESANKILRLLSKVLYELNLKLNSTKTFMYDDLILDAIKSDKIYWTTQYESFVQYSPVKNQNKVTNELVEDEDDQVDDYLDNKFRMEPSYFKISIQKHLLQIKILGNKYPNCGQLRKALTDLYKYRIFDLSEKPDDLEQLISITVQIMLDNPTTIQHCVVIISKLLGFFVEDNATVKDILSKIIFKFKDKSNTDIVEIWLQRIALLSDPGTEFTPKICQFSKVEDFSVWNSTWMSEEFRFSDIDVIDTAEKEAITYAVPKEEIDKFSSDRSQEEE